MAAAIWVLVPVVGILCGMLAIYVEHRQKMAMIEKGINPVEKKTKDSTGEGGLVIGGLVLVGIGLAFLVTQLITQLEAWLYLPGFFFFFMGIALVIAYFVLRASKKKS